MTYGGRARAGLVPVLVACALLLAAAKPAAAFEAEVRVAAIPGAKIAWYERGRGEPLLMLTGTGSTMAEWDPALLRLLARDHRLVLLDYPGAGLSGRWGGPRGFDGLADAVARFIAASGLERANVLGWSMGGFVAQRLAIGHPGRVERLVLAGTNPGGGHAVLGTPKAQEVDSDPDPPLDAILGQLYPPRRQGEARAFVRRLERASRSGEIPDDFQVAPATVRAQVAAEDPWLRSDRNYRQLAGLAIPVLATAGRQDPVTPAVNMRRIANQVPSAKLRVFAGAHAFLFQQRRAFARALSQFLRSGSPLYSYALRRTAAITFRGV